MSTKPCLGYPGHTCPAVVRNRSRCTTCEARYRPSPNARGYDAQYRKDRAPLIGQPCGLRLPGCTGTADTAHHVDGVGNSTTLIPACNHCNSSDGQGRRRR